MKNETTTFKINGKEIDLTNPKDIEEAKATIQEWKNNPVFKLFGNLFNVDYCGTVDAICNKLDELQEDVQKKLEVKEEEDKKDWYWADYGIDWDNKWHCIADEYLSDNFEGFDGMDPEVQARHIKTIAAFCEWLDNREDNK